MSVKLRLARAGRKGKPFYKIVAANVTAPRDGKFLEKVGYFDPLLESDNEKRLVINKERAEHWLKVGAVPSDRVANLLISLGVAGAEKYKPKFIVRDKGYGAKAKALEKIEKEKEKLESAKVEKEAETVAK
jgi:small subunit ribosomal protein S16|tara:strand:- start:18723 stop:19115 length:393 start_codon:yes stop_codon:yes gene_type:complete